MKAILPTVAQSRRPIAGHRVRLLPDVIVDRVPAETCLRSLIVFAYNGITGGASSTEGAAPYMSRAPSRTFRRRGRLPHRLRPSDIRPGALPTRSGPPAHPRGTGEARPQAEARAIAGAEAVRAEPCGAEAKEAAAGAPCARHIVSLDSVHARFSARQVPRIRNKAN